MQKSLAVTGKVDLSHLVKAVKAGTGDDALARLVPSKAWPALAPYLSGTSSNSL